MGSFAHLAVPYYLDQVKEREEEVTSVLRRNLENPVFERVHVFCEDPEEAYAVDAAQTLLRHPKVCRVQLSRRATYRDLFIHLSREAPGQICVGAYCDIYFDETLALVEGADLSGMFLALAKWDVGRTAEMRDKEHFADKPKVRGKGPYSPRDSQDCWIFRAPLQEFPSDYGFGIPGDENLLAYQAHKAGLLVANPSLSIKAWHLHESGVRRWTRKDRMWDLSKMEASELPDMMAVSLDDVMRVRQHRQGLDHPDVEVRPDR